MIMFFDTETTGLPDWRQSSESPTQPHIVQLAILLMNDDGTEFGIENMIVKPDGWIISDEVAAIHGITHERAMDEGIKESAAVLSYIAARGLADVSVAHNHSFDERIMRIAMLRGGFTRPFITALESLKKSCTCTESTHIVNLPPSERMAAKGMTMPKSPKLVECMRHFFGEELPGAHDAEVDVRACARVYFHLRSLEKAT